MKRMVPVPNIDRKVLSNTSNNEVNTGGTNINKKHNVAAPSPDER